MLSFLGSKEAAMMKRVPRVVAALAVLGLISAACGSSKKTAATGSSTTTREAGAPSSPPAKPGTAAAGNRGTASISPAAVLVID